MDKSHDPVFFIWAHQNASQRGEETEMTLLPISHSLPCQTLCFSFGCQEILQMHISEEDQSIGKLLLCGANGESVRCKNLLDKNVKRLCYIFTFLKYF